MSDEQHKPWCTERTREKSGVCICQAESSFAAPAGCDAVPKLLEDYRRERAQYLSCVKTDVFAKRRGHMDGMKTIAMKIAEELLKHHNNLRQGGRT